jgi:hypothetical protein
MAVLRYYSVAIRSPHSEHSDGSMIVSEKPTMGPPGSAQP